MRLAGLQLTGPTLCPRPTLLTHRREVGKVDTKHIKVRARSWWLLSACSGGRLEPPAPAL